MRLSPIHPFPARMAPEIVFHQLRGMASDALVLDPMAGSGTVLRAAAELGHRAIGFDLDPLAVLMARVWTTPFRAKDLPKAAERFVHQPNFCMTNTCRGLTIVRRRRTISSSGSAESSEKA